MKKFENGDIIINVIKAHPKVEFFANGGVVHFNRQNYPAAESNVEVESVGLFDNIHRLYGGPLSGSGQ